MGKTKEQQVEADFDLCVKDGLLEKVYIDGEPHYTLTAKGLAFKKAEPFPSERAEEIWIKNYKETVQ